MTNSLDLQLEIKSVSGRKFEGYGSVFRNVDLGGDIVMPGAFKRSLAQHTAAGTKPLMYWMHKPDMVPGVWEDLEEDNAGLRVAGELVDTQLGNEVGTLLKKKAVRGLSIGYRPTARGVDYDADGNRLLKELDLWEVSIVSMAMNPLAAVESMKANLSAHGEYVPTVREFEQRLREWGCSKNTARMLLARLYGDAPGGMPGQRWDAGDDEAKAALDAALRCWERIGAAIVTDRTF